MYMLTIASQADSHIVGFLRSENVEPDQLPSEYCVNMYYYPLIFVPQVGFTALMWASSKAHSETVSILLSAGAQADLQDKVR